MSTAPSSLHTILPRQMKACVISSSSLSRDTDAGFCGSAPSPWISFCWSWALSSDCPWVHPSYYWFLLYLYYYIFIITSLILHLYYYIFIIISLLSYLWPEATSNIFSSWTWCIMSECFNRSVRWKHVRWKHVRWKHYRNVVFSTSYSGSRPQV